MSGNIHVNVFIQREHSFTEGYRLGVLLNQDITLMFMEDDPAPQLEQLRDECQRQIDALRLPSNAPAAELAAQVGALEPSAAPPLDGQPAHDPGEQVIALDEPDIPF